jgi:hypothetical protein
MQIDSVGIDLGKTTFHLVALGTAGKVLARRKFTQKTVAGLHREHADLADRPGRRALAPTSSAGRCASRGTTSG